MSLFGGKKSTKTYGAIIDIGSGSVGVGILESDSREKLPKVIFAHRELMRFTIRSGDNEERIRQMREALFTASLVLSSEGLKRLGSHNPNAKIKRILVTCSSPWSHTVSRVVSHESEKEFKISESLIKDLAQNAEQELIDTFDADMIVGSLGLRIVERATVGIKVNGYLVHEPTHIKGQKLELSHITGLIPEDILSAVEEVQEKILVDTEVSAHTFMLINYCVMRDIFPNNHSMTLVDVTGESTEIGIVEDNILSEDIHIPYGSNTLIRDVTDMTKGTPDHSVSLLRAQHEGTATDEEKAAEEKYLQNYTETLTEYLQKVHKRRILPKTMVVTALPQLEGLFRTHIQRVVSEVMGAEYTVLTLGKEVLDQIAAEKNSDTFIALASRFFHKLHGCGEIKTL